MASIKTTITSRRRSIRLIAQLDDDLFLIVRCDQEPEPETQPEPKLEPASERKTICLSDEKSPKSMLTETFACPTDQELV